VNDARANWSNYVRVNKDVTVEEATAKFNALALEEYDQWAKAREKVQAAQYAGATHRELAEILKTEKAANTTQITSLLNGKFTPTVLSMEKLTQDKAAEIREAKKANRPEKIKEIEAKYAMLTATLPKLIRTFKVEE
jgi:hypothetical protein